MKKVLLTTGLLSFFTGSVAQVVVTQGTNEVKIGNTFMERTFSLSDSTLRPGALVNRRANATFTPTAGTSEEFALNLLSVRKIEGLLNSSAWTVEADGYTPESGTGLPEHAFDGNASTYWHSNYNDASKIQMPHYLLFDLKTSQNIGSFGYTPRSSNPTHNGQVKGYEIWVGETPETLVKVTEGNITFSGDEQWINLPQVVTGRYVKFVVTSAQNGRQFAAVGEFRLSSQAQQAPKTTTTLPRTGWTVSASSWCQENATVGLPSFVLDGNPSTLWHSWYPGQAQGTINNSALPHTLTFNLGKETSFRSFGYQPRSGLGNGTIKGYRFEISSDSTKWEVVKSGEFTFNDASVLWTDLGRTVSARYVRLVETSELNGQTFGTCAEFYLSADEISSSSASFAASNMRIKEVTVNDIEDGKKVVFAMKPYTYTDAKTGQSSVWNVSMVVEMKNNDHFLRKYLLIDGDEVARNTPIDYIEFDRLGVDAVPEANRWTHPSSSGGVGGMTGYTLTLGQPTYIEGMFFGSEFPQVENEISDGATHTRYYSGKSLNTITRSSDAYKTWNNVVGATRSVTDLNVIRTDFFTYINSIARPTALRLQYNSWYDWMMRIDEQKINSSFMEIERGLTQYGVRPVDSYVVDDGWNNYNVNDVERSGTTNNQTGFWEFNSKFPTGLTGASQIAKKLGSSFGIWLGPRGGYNFNDSWGQFLERHGTGTYNRVTGDAVTGDSVYIQKLQEFFLKCQREYGVNYWKLDGFSTKQPQPSTNGRYITGGKNGNYYFTEHWERWYNTLDTLYQEAAQRDAKLWINLTCYVNPSPWILQWSNSVWIQNSQDMGRTTVGSRSRELDKQLSYRDDRYFDFYNTQQLQFPMANIFNHDPIYGKENAFASNAMTPSEFRAYLYMMATRGTAFWEMLYSYTMMNETNKWMVNAEALKFIEDNYATLRNAIYHGATSPASGSVYGFSSWNKTENATEGIISFRNPSSESKTYSLTLNSTIGVPENASGLWRSLVMEYSGSQSELPADVETGDNNTTAFNYGQTLTLTLKPGEIRIWKFSTRKDDKPAAIYNAQATAVRTVTVQFDEPTKATKEQFTLTTDNGTAAPAVASVSRGADYRTYTLTLVADLADNTPYKVQVNGAQDWNSNTTAATSSPFYLNPDGTVLRIDSPEDVATPTTVTTGGDFRDGLLLTASQPVAAASNKQLVGNTAFGINFALQTTNADGTLFSAGSDYSVALSGGKIVFTVGSLRVESSATVNDNQRYFVSCTRENNGMIKVYVNGELQASAYDGKMHALTGAPFVLGNNIAVGDVELRQDAQAFSKVASEAADYTATHYLVTVKNAGDLPISFLNHQATATIDGNIVARFVANKHANVRATLPTTDASGNYLVDGVTRTFNAGQSTISVLFTSIAADHEVDFGNITGIDGVAVTPLGKPSQVYDLNGRRIMTFPKGVYIVDGKKVIR